MSETQEYCKTILSQLKWKGLAVLMSWGAHRFTNMGNKVEKKKKKEDGYDAMTLSGRACLRFNVQGALHKGLVYVLLTGVDDYTIVLTRPKRCSKNNPVAYEEIVKEVEGIYCDELADTVDRLVETP